MSSFGVILYNWETVDQAWISLNNSPERSECTYKLSSFITRGKLAKRKRSLLVYFMIFLS